jgi:hypothetical protein
MGLWLQFKFLTCFKKTILCKQDGFCIFKFYKT